MLLRYQLKLETQMDPFENTEPIKFTSLLRDKLRQTRKMPTYYQTHDQASQLKLVSKRNIEIKRAFELSKEGILVDASKFEPETSLMRICRLSTNQQLNNLYEDFKKQTQKFTALRMTDDANLARHWKYLNNDKGEGKLHRSLDKDYFSWKEEHIKRGAGVADALDTIRMSLNQKRSHLSQEILKAELLQQNGFQPYNPKTFDHIFMNGWQHCGEESSDDEALAEPSSTREKTTLGAFDLCRQNVEEETSGQGDQTDPAPEMMEEPPRRYVEPAEPALDIDMVDPRKVNWFKFLVDKHLSHQNSVLNNTDAYANLLQLLLSRKLNDELQEELVELVGFENLLLVEELLTKREFIQEYCGKLIKEKEKEQASVKGPKTYDSRPQVGVSVTWGKNKKGKSQGQQQYEMSKGSNYDLLLSLGFNKELINQNKVLGMKERTINDLKQYVLESAQGLKEGLYEIERTKEEQAQIYKQKLGAGTKSKIVTDDYDDYRFVSLTPPPKDPINTDDLVSINTLPKWCHQSFSTTKHLNTIQSIVFPVAFKQTRSMLICAPTGAGKTNIALMTILREISQHIGDDHASKSQWSVRDKQFKIIYIAPLKALASEIVTKFQQALGYLGVHVRELTGDMGLTKQEMQETHVIVATPEKWDVVTRKTDGMMGQVNVMIIDEIHLLNDERGLVIECLVARALSTGIKNQKPIRIVGLSATLPNYEEVGDFIGADSQGIFAFDSSYRPTPLKCSFYGIKEAGNAQRANNVMNEVIFDNLLRILRMGKQIIIFMHKRAETYSTAVELVEILKTKGSKYMHLFDCENSYKRQKEVSASRNQQVKELFQYGFSTHHAGMLRKDRNLVEKMFMDGDIKVLCSTSTLAWGVNLPAYAVLIKGTKVYDSSIGAYKDVGIFDVQQIFGRAGRPQFDNEGEAIILTPNKQMDHYVSMMQNKEKVESNLEKGLANCINAEIASGQITTITEGVQWLKKSFYYRRMLQNPVGYSIKRQELQMDPTGHMVLLDKIQDTVQKLNSARLIRYNRQTEQVFPTDMGRIASNYYINVETMGTFMEKLKPYTQENILLFNLAQASEFKQLDARKEEYEEMKQLCAECTVVEVDKASYNEAYTKVLCLLEAYLKNRAIKTFSLISDMAYVVQNSARLLRAMFEIALQRNYSELAKVALKWTQIIDKRILPYAHPMRQFTQACSVGKLTNPNQHVTKYGYLQDTTVYRLDQFNVTMNDLYDRKLDEAANYISPVHQDEMYKFLGYMPYIDVEVDYQPITRTILKVVLSLSANFHWNDRWNGNSEPFWIIVDNEEEILHQEFFALQKKDVARGRSGMKNEDTLQVVFFIPYQVPEGYERIPAGTNYNLEVISDRWFGVRFHQLIELEGLSVPDEDYPMTRLLPLRPIPVTVFNDPAFESLYNEKFSFFNPIQTQVFHTLYHTDSNVLVGAPTGSGKTIISELAMLRVFKQTPKKKVIYIAPLKALAKERIIDWKLRLGGSQLKKSVLELTGDCTPDLMALKEADLLITTPEKWDGISRNWQHRSYVSDVALVVIDEIHLLGQDRGPVIEVIISRMRYIAEQTGSTVRFVGLSTALANAKDVADWLGIHKLGLFNFKPSVRPVPIKVFFQGFPEKHYCPRMATMNRPTYKAINTHSREHPVLVFVSSRRQTRLTALDLIALSAADQQEKMANDDGYDLDFKKPFLHMDSEEIHMLSEYIKDENLRHTIQFGVGMHHAGLEESDRKIVEDLFVKKKIQILVTTSTLAWGVNFPARLVVVKGTEFFDPAKKRYVDFPLTDLLQMIGRAGRPGHDDHGVACVMVSEEKKNFYKKFLYEPFPVESSLAQSLTDHMNAEIAAGTLSTKKHCIDYLTWTYFFRRLTKNPGYYNVDVNDANGINNFLRDLVNKTLAKLVLAECIEVDNDTEDIRPTTLGYLASFYYLSHETVKDISVSLSNPQDIGQLIDVLSKAKEFAGLPVRHNEDVLNEALSHLVPLKVPKHNLESPHVKANLLLQAHFDRCPLPITDFITDTKSVLDQSIRVLQGMIDIASHKGSLKNTLNLINLMQMLIQGQWLNQSPFLNLPNINTKRIQQLKQMGISHLVQLMDQNVNDVLKKLGMSKEEELEAVKVLQRIPQIDIKWSVVAIDERNQPQENKLLEPSGEAQIVISLRRTNPHQGNHISMSNFPKPKEVGWFVVVANPDTEEVVCLKRMSFKRAISKSLIVVLPDDFETPLQVLLMCDSFIGLDQTYSINLDRVNERIKADNKPSATQQKKKVVVEEPLKPDLASDESSDGFCHYNKLYQQANDDEVVANQTNASDDESFEFDVQAEDIYDLTVF